jgi:hypothetical protein
LYTLQQTCDSCLKWATRVIISVVTSLRHFSVLAVLAEFAFALCVLTARNPVHIAKTHEAKFGLRVCERHCARFAAKSVVCHLCVVFGREEKVGTKRKARGAASTSRHSERITIFGILCSSTLKRGRSMPSSTEHRSKKLSSTQSMFLERRFSAVEINCTGDYLSKLQRVYRKKSAFKAAVDTRVSYMDFRQCLEVTTGRFSDHWRFVAA